MHRRWSVHWKEHFKKLHLNMMSFKSVGTIINQPPGKGNVTVNLLGDETKNDVQFDKLVNVGSAKLRG